MKLNRIIIYLTVFSLSILFVIFIYQFVYLPNSVIKSVDSCVPINFRKEIKNSEIYLMWNTKSECTGYVKYGTTPETFPYFALDAQGIVKLKTHEVKLSGVDIKSNYYIVIISDDKTYGSDGLPLNLNL